MNGEHNQALNRSGQKRLLSTALPILIRRGFTGAAALFAERRCGACMCVFAPTKKKERPSGVDDLFCPACIRAMPRRKMGLCPRCGEPAPWPELPPALCGNCLTKEPPWQAFFCHSTHEGLLRDLLLRLKFKGDIALAYALGLMLAAHPGFCGLSFDAVTPVPLHRDRLRFRGYNQALELARPVAHALGVCLEPGLLIRSLSTAPQTGANRKDRKKGMKNAFISHEGVRNKRVLLVDDTLTTGATIEASTLALLAAGAAGVDAAVLSRTPRYSWPKEAQGWAD